MLAEPPADGNGIMPELPELVIERLEKMLVAERSHLRGPDTGSPIGIGNPIDPAGAGTASGWGASIPMLPPSTWAAARAASSGHSTARGKNLRTMSSVLPS